MHAPHKPSAKAIAHADEMTRWMQDDGREFHIKLAIGLDTFAAEHVRALKIRIDNRLNNHLVDMQEGYDDSIVGFNEAWDIVRSCFEEPR